MDKKKNEVKESISRDELIIKNLFWIYWKEGKKFFRGKKAKGSGNIFKLKDVVEIDKGKFNRALKGW